MAIFTTCTSTMVVLFPFYGERYFQAAQRNFYHQKYNHALSNIDRALFLNPDNAKFLSYKGDILLTKRNATDTLADIRSCTRCEEIIKWYEKASRTARTTSLYLIKKAIILERYTDKSAAEATYKEAIHLSPMYSDYYYRLAALYLRQRKLDEAINSFRQFLQLEGVKEVPKVLDDIWSAGGDYQIQQRVIPEVASFRQAFASYLMRDDKNKLAEQEAAFAFTLDPTVSNALIHLNILRGNKNLPELLASIERYQLRFPKEIKLKERYAAALEQTKQYQKAISVYRQLLEEFPEKKGRSEIFFMKIAQLYSQQKLYKDAVSVLQEGIARYPRAAGLYQNLANYFNLMKNNEEALYALKKAVSLDPDNASFRYQLGHEYLSNKLEQEALRQWEACLTINPNYTNCKKGIKHIRNKLGLLPPAPDK